MDDNKEPFSFGVIVVIEIVVPLSGFNNMLVYFLPKCLKYQKTHPGTWLVMSYWHILILTSIGYCSWCSKLFNNVNPGGDDTTNEEMITNSSDMNFASYNTLPNIDTNTSQIGDGSGNERESGKSDKKKYNSNSNRRRKRSRSRSRSRSK
mmetsp:Transcript_25666/g.27571  ORF Transcript_25666/g.27571 Transcript_25666/m.27571 type:complete len:150 (-) Transcript_25666:257-706(-)